ncbi:MAG: tetratricopeptide repeat protein [Phycisphaerales bacterium]|nr:tetratricopeptide repeat protein [Phycisphaerales bacterium]
MHCLGAWIFALFLTISTVAVKSDVLSDQLNEVQNRRNLHIEDEGALVDRRWSFSSTKQSLREYIQAREMFIRGNDAAGLGLLSSATNFDKDNAAAWRMLALYWEGVGRQDYAREAWEQVGRINPHDVDSQYFLGLESSRKGNVEEAVSLLLSWRLGGGKESLVQSAVPRPDKVMRGEAVLAELLYNLNEPAAAETVRQSLRDDIDAMVKGKSRYRMGQDKWLDVISMFQSDGAQRSAFDGVMVLSDLPQINPQTRKSLLDMSIGIAILFDDGSEISTVIDQLPDSMIEYLVPEPVSQSARADLLFEIATLYSTMGNRAGAAWLYEDVLEHDPTNVMARNNLAYYEMVRGRLDSSTIRMLETAWRDAPEHPAILDSYGWLQYVQGRFEDDDEGPGAISLLEQANERSGQQPSPEILDHLGDAYYRAGQPEAAREAWSSGLAILLDPAHRQNQIRMLQELQGMVWGRRIRKESAVYDLEFGPLAISLEAKLVALDAGEPCPVQPLATVEEN